MREALQPHVRILLAYRVPLLNVSNAVKFALIELAVRQELDRQELLPVEPAPLLARGQRYEAPSAAARRAAADKLGISRERVRQVLKHKPDLAHPWAEQIEPIAQIFWQRQVKCFPAVDLLEWLLMDEAIAVAKCNHLEAARMLSVHRNTIWNFERRKRAALGRSA